MGTQSGLQAVENSVAKVEDEVSVGEDLEFQRKWWRFENAVWWIFGVILALDLAGAFGRGPLAKAERRAADGSIDLKYERIERTGTPSVMRVELGPDVARDGHVKLYVSESVVKELGAERVIPAPLSTEIGGGGLTYTFPVSGPPASVEFELQPSGPGKFSAVMRVPGKAPIEAGVVVVP